MQQLPMPRQSIVTQPLSPGRQSILDVLLAADRPLNILDISVRAKVGEGSVRDFGNLLVARGDAVFSSRENGRSMRLRYYELTSPGRAWAKMTLYRLRPVSS